ncbi:hypothetical protein TRFO_33673 [Tritrichomonas foetus]|uniref:CWH43-like N-terminal domain-containing protein n=1 Tax=Tritrichomonas foetus TaxID=1144522 RepID=A0A1J4JL39_9EUKA|nr:hypothetical protein TRFO_33673 [Tritrichomonas foetus]|eukprot:OHS99802.1 hypothetical protein TRFO_33673 [Tritrichomonas foetus]
MVNSSCLNASQNDRLNIDLMQHNLIIWYYIGAIFPFLAVIVSWICFYSLGQYDADYLLTISETMVPFPQNRIFPSAMCIESIILIGLYFVRNVAIFSVANRLSIQFPVKKWLIYITSICVPLGLVLLSTFTLEDVESIHLIGAFLFFFGSMVYYITSDLALIQTNNKIMLASRILSFSIVGAAVFYFAFLMGRKKWSLTVGASFQYLTALLIFAKVIFMYYDLPKHYVVICFDEKI